MKSTYLLAMTMAAFGSMGSIGSVKRITRTDMPTKNDNSGMNIRSHSQVCKHQAAGSKLARKAAKGTLTVRQG